MDKRQEVVKAAKSFVGAKWVHQGRRPDGMDCAGLVVLTGKKAGLLDDSYVDYTNYRRQPDGNSFKAQFDKYATRTVWTKAQEGDILIFGKGVYNFHCGILFFKHDKPYMIHGYSESGLIMEQPLTEHWFNRMTLVYKYRGID